VRVFSAALLLIGSVSAYSEEAESPTTTTLPKIKVSAGVDDDYVPPETSSSTKSNVPVLLTPQSIQVVPRAVLNEQNALTLTDAVRNIAGTGSDFGFNGSAQPLLMLRGFQTTSMTAMGDMSGMSSYYVNGIKVQGVPINMANVDSVEVVKGPASVLFGRSEPGGLVNVVTRELSPTPRLGFEQTLGQFSQSRTVLEGEGALNEGKTFLGRVNGSYDTAKSNRDFVENRLAAFSGTLAWVPDEGSRVALSWDHNAQKYRNDFGIPANGRRPADLPRSRQFNDSPDLSSITSDTVTLDAQKQLGKAWTLKARAVSLHADTHEVDLWPWRVDNGLGPTPADTCADTNPLVTLCRYYFYVRPAGRVKLDQVTVDMLGDVQVAGLRHQLLLEAEHYATQKTGTLYFQQVSSVNVANPVLGNGPPLDTATAFPSETESHNRWTSFVAQDQVTLGKSWHAVLALRHDRTSAIYAPPGTPPNEESFTTPRIGLVWEFRPQQTLYAQFQNSVAANNGRDGFGVALQAERARQIEVGWKNSALQGRFSTTIALFQLTKRNRADFSLYPVITTVGEARSRGLEIDTIGQLTEHFAVMGSFTLLDARVTEDVVFKGTRLADVARESGSLWGRWVFNTHWAAGGGVFAQGQREGDQGNTFELPGYARVDAMVSYGFRAGSGRGTVQFNLKNAFDTVYYSGSHQLLRDWIQPGAPRTASVTLRIDL
jgi:iron complex outermembrane receptor protein